MLVGRCHGALCPLTCPHILWPLDDMLNAHINRQLLCGGATQMHVHIAHFDSKRSAPGVLQANWLVRRMARTVNVSRDAKDPTRVVGEGYFNPLAYKHTPLGRPPKDWARAYFIHVPSQQPAADLGVRQYIYAGLSMCVLWKKLCRRKRAACCVGLLQTLNHASCRLAQHVELYKCLPCLHPNSVNHGDCSRQSHDQLARRLMSRWHVTDYLWWWYECLAWELFLQHSIKPFQLARTIAAASDLPSHGYGITVMPRTLSSHGLLVAVVWSTSDSEQLDETELAGDPIRYSHTCHQYIGTGQHQLWQPIFDKGGRWLSKSWT